MISLFLSDSQGEIPAYRASMRFPPIGLRARQQSILVPAIWATAVWRLDRAGALLEHVEKTNLDLGSEIRQLKEPLFGAGLPEDASTDGNRPSHRSSIRADHKAISRNNFQ